MPRKKNTPHVRRISPGTRMLLLTIYPPWLLSMFPYSYWALTCEAVLPTYSAFMISVRQAGDLPPASFRFPVTRDTLALGYILPAVGRIRDFHPLKHAPAGRTSKNPLRFLEPQGICITQRSAPLRRSGWRQRPSCFSQTRFSARRPRRRAAPPSRPSRCPGRGSGRTPASGR